MDAAREAADVHRLIAEIQLIDERLERPNTHRPNTNRPQAHVAMDSHATQAILDGVLGTERCLGDIDAELRLKGFQ